MNSRPILLDTHTALWLAGGEQLADPARQALDHADETGAGIYLSPISLWEIGLLVARGRIALSCPPMDWAGILLGLGVRWSQLAPEILVDSSFLPGDIHGDPADRILVATARAGGLSLMTRDEKLLRYAGAGHMHAVRC